MYTLGISYLSHDSSAVLLKNDRILCAVEEERLNRKKHYSGFPVHSMKKCLDVAGISIEDVDVIASDGVTLDTRKQRISNYIRMCHYEKAIREIKFAGEQTAINTLNKDLLDNGFAASSKLKIYDHHQCHASSAFFPSGHKTSNVATADARGFFKTQTFWEGEDEDLILKDTRVLPESPGYVYKYITYLCGFGSFAQGTTMALAPYGKPTIANDMFKIFPLVSTWTDIMTLIDAQFSKSNFDDNKLMDSAYDKLEPSEREDIDKIKSETKENLAASVQKWLEDYLIDYILKNRNPKIENISLAGGSFLNCILNSRLKNEYFKEVFVQPAASDAGLSLGAAVLANDGKIETMEHAYLGPEYDDDEICESIEKNKLAYELSNEKHAAELIAEGKIIGWFQGKMEFGPRALGNRSIIADPSNLKTKQRLNNEVKIREEFRPYAPSILHEKIGDIFEDPYKSPFMTLAFKVREDRINDVSAITHIDGTSRVQTVHKHTNPKYHKLISEFESLKNIPLVLNTSFNGRGDPIVNTPQEAIDMYLNSGIDYLFLGNRIVYKKKKTKKKIPNQDGQQ